jgi:glycosyltransferase involved in cell wall biosynthesis
VVAVLTEGLHARGHRVTLFASGDSKVPCELVPVLPQSMWSGAYRGSGAEYLDLVAAAAWQRAAEFDVIHSHLEGAGFLLGRHGPTPLVTTFHSRLDLNGMPERLAAFPELPLVSISDSQRRWAPDGNWVATVHHGTVTAEMPFGAQPGEYLLFVGRIAPEKGIGDAIDLARSTGIPLRVAAKVRERAEQELFEASVRPAIDEGVVVEYKGELEPAERDELFAGALATLMLGSWPEPFGLVAIESMATGTPVIARRAGALTETVRHGETGFLVDDLREAELAVARVAELDRARIRDAALRRFTPDVMLDKYEAVYRRVIASASAERPVLEAPVAEAPVAEAPLVEAPQVSIGIIGADDERGWSGRSARSGGVPADGAPAGSRGPDRVS